MAGAGYKLFNTGDVLLASEVNTYLMQQTVMVFANSTARTSALSGVLAEGMISYLADTNATEVYNGSAWVGVSGTGDVTEVQAGTGISVASGTGPIPVVTNSMATEITAAGDIIVGTGSGTFDNLPIGTTGQVLTADTTVSPYKVKWAAAASGGGYTLLETLSLSGSSTTSSTLSTSYKHLFVVVKDVYISGNDNVAMRLNGDSNTRYYAQAIEIDNTSISGKNETDGRFYIVDSGNNSAAVNNCYGTIFIPRYTDTSSVVQIESTFSGYIVGNKRGKIVWGFYDNSAAVTSITLLAGTATFSAGTAYIYGVS